MGCCVHTTGRIPQGWPRAAVQDLLSWTESYRVDLEKDTIPFTFVDATETIGDQESEGVCRPRTLRDLLASGEIVSILE